MLHQEVELWDRNLNLALPQKVEQQPLDPRHENHTLLLITSRIQRQSISQTQVEQVDVELVRG